MNHHHIRKVTAALAACVATLCLAGAAYGLPSIIPQEGVAYDNDGLALAGDFDIQVDFYANAEGGDPLFTEVHRGVEFVDGWYSILVGSIDPDENPLEASVFNREAAFLGITIGDGDELAPRLPIGKVPAAFVSDVAIDAVGDINPTSVTITGENGSIPVINNEGQWIGDPTGLRGAQGPQGPRGPAGGDGQAADPQDVIDALLDDADALPFVSDRLDDTKAGNLTMNGNLIMNGTNVSGVGTLSLRDNDAQIGMVDGALRLLNDVGVAIQGENNRVIGNLTVSGSLRVVGELIANIVRITTLNVTNLNVTNLNGPNNRINVVGDLALNRNVLIGANSSFVGTVRAGGVASAGTVTAGQNITAAGSITAGGNVSSGGNGRLTAGSGGIYVGNLQVVDGNGNVRVPPSACPPGHVMYSTARNGAARCVNVTCAAGSSFRGFNANDLSPICQPDRGIVRIPPNSCGEGQALVRITENGTTQCRQVGGGGAGEGVCPDTLEMVGFKDNGDIMCNCTAHAHCAGNEYCNGGRERCQAGCRNDAGCPAHQYCTSNQCRNGCRNDAGCPFRQWCNNHRCVAGCKNDNECPGNNVCRNHQCTSPSRLITGNGEAFGNHGRCSGWNQCGSARTCATWACLARGAGRLVSFGRNGSCRGFRVCHLFRGRWNSIQWNWGNWCGVYGVSEIRCSG